MAAANGWRVGAAGAVGLQLGDKVTWFRPRTVETFVVSLKFDMNSLSDDERHVLIGVAQALMGVVGQSVQQIAQGAGSNIDLEFDPKAPETPSAASSILQAAQGRTGDEADLSALLSLMYSALHPIELKK